MRTKYLFLTIFAFIFSFSLKAQVGGNIRGNFQTIIQTYKQDTLIHADDAPEKVLMNSYANFIYTKDNFTAGFRYEGYFNTLQGYDSKNDGFGIPYKFAQYSADNFDITVGNFYDQFGSGLIFRTYEDKYIGYDNAMHGIRVKFNPVQGLYLSGIAGKQRYAFSKLSAGYSQVINKGLVRGVNIDFSPNETFSKLNDAKTNLLFGFSFVSKYQQEQKQYLTIGDTTYLLKMPENVSAFSGRFNISRGAVAFNSEYAYKINDPSAENDYIYKPGNALFMNLSLSKKGFGFILSALRIDNFGFRSDRTATLSDLNIGYVPDITRNHIYAFAAMYPFATQNNGEMGISSEITFKIKKHSKIGGKYGIDIRLNYSRMHDIYKQQIADDIPIGQKGTDGYISDFFKVGDNLFYQDINIQITKKATKNFKFVVIWQNLIFNYAVLRGEPEEKTVYGDVGILDMTYKIKPKNYIRLELETMQTHQDMGDWAMALIEYTISPHWFFSTSDQYNYQNPKGLEAHYYNAAFGYKINATRLQFSYGRQREGVVCIGGVCRAVPATNGFMFSLTSSF